MVPLLLRGVAADAADGAPQPRLSGKGRTVVGREAVALAADIAMDAAGPAADAGLLRLRPCTTHRIKKAKE